MAVAIETFAKQLVESGLITQDELKALIIDLPADSRPKDGEQLARELVRQKKLTGYQAQQIYTGKGKQLFVGNYVVHEKLGQGGMGTVLKAEHKRMHRMVALKIISVEAMKSPDAVKRFQREVQAAARLIHANIVTAFDADEFDGRHVLVMEFVDGSDLSTHVKKSGPLPPQQALECIRDAARGLEFAHKQGVVHRDIKPGNLLLSTAGPVKILDMGLARLDSTQESAEITSTGQVMGTVDYMAPEQALSTKEADGRADIYSLGITLWYLVTGKPAYTGDSIMEKLLAHREKPIPSLREACPDVTPAIESIFQKMAAKTPEERYPSMTALLVDVERALAGNTAAPAAPALRGGASASGVGNSQLNAFLAGQSRGPGASGIGVAGRSGIGVGGSAIGSGSDVLGSGQVATAGGSSRSSVRPQDETVNRSAEVDTDPDTPQPWAFTPAGGTPSAKSNPPAASPLPARPAAAQWWDDWRVLVGIGVGTALLVVAVGLLIFGGRGKPQAPISAPPTAPVDPSPAAVTGVSALPEFKTVTQLFNGSDLTGWKVKGAQGWSALGGVLVGSGSGAPGWLCTDRQVQDFQLELEYKLEAGCNSGIFLRAPENGDLAGRQLVEVQLLDNPAFPAATSNMLNLSLHSESSPATPQPVVPGTWHKVLVTVAGRRIYLDHDGNRVIGTSTGKLPARGHLGLQLPKGRIEFRNLVLREP